MKNLNNLNLIPLKANYFEKFIVLFFPISILLGNFMIDFTLTLIAIYFLFISIRYKLLSYYKNIFAYAFFSIYFIILINGIISDDVKESLLNNEGAIFYFRYFFFYLLFNLLF